MNLAQIKRDLVFVVLGILNSLLKIFYVAKGNSSLPSNNLGLAAGFDKDAKYLFVWEFLKFGFVEIGTVLRRPQNPNPGKIVGQGKDVLWNYMGFPSSGVENVKNNLKKYRDKKGSLHLMASLGPNRDVSDPELITKDILESAQILIPYINSISLNFASPNTQNLRDKMQSDWFEKLLIKMRETSDLPIFLKLHPDLEIEELQSVVQMAKPHVTGIIFSNTTKKRVPPYDKFAPHGGLSGKLLFKNNLKLIPEIRKVLGHEKSLIACGGVMSNRDIVAYQEAGANLVQVYSGLVLRPLKLLSSTRQIRKR